MGRVLGFIGASLTFCALVAACGSSGGSSAGFSPSPGTKGGNLAASNMPTASPKTGNPIPPQAWRIKRYNHTSLYAWCIVTKTTDQNGNPSDWAQVTIDNTGNYSAEISALGIDLFNAHGQHVHISGTPIADDANLLGSGIDTTIEAPSGQLTPIGGNGAQGSGIPASVDKCAVYSLDQYTNPRLSTEG